MLISALKVQTLAREANPVHQKGQAKPMYLLVLHRQSIVHCTVQRTVHGLGFFMVSTVLWPNSYLCWFCFATLIDLATITEAMPSHV